MSETTVRFAPAGVIPLWVKVVVILCAVLTGMGGVIAFLQPGMLLQPNAEITDAVRIYAGYLTARNLVLALMLFALLMAKARRALGNLLAILGLIQLLDCAMDCLEARWTVALGVLVLGIIFLAAASRLCGQLWRRDAWM
jgi:hypothetical protein